MTWMMKSCFVTLVILFLWRVEEGAEACSCLNISPEQKICKSDVVIKARVTGKNEVDQTELKFGIKVIKVFKGPRAIDAVYTSGPCRAFLDPNGGKPYLITGQLGADGKVRIILCDVIKPWENLSGAQLRIVKNSKHYCG